MLPGSLNRAQSVPKMRDILRFAIASYISQPQSNHQSLFTLIV